MTQAQILTHWNWEPSVLAGLALFAFAYLAASGPLRARFANSRPVTRWQTLSFLSALIVLFLALLSPLDLIADNYLFSAHMTQHLILTLAFPILLLLGIPEWMLRPSVLNRNVLTVTRLVTHPVSAYILLNAVFTAWHLPAIYDLQFQREPFHVLTHLLFMATAIIMWLPILSPLRELRLSPGLQAIYLFFLSIPATGLAAFLTLAPRVLYVTYAQAPRVFGISALDDQVLAGLIMWIPGTLVYLGAITLIFFRWFGHDETSEAGQSIGV